MEIIAKEKHTLRVTMKPADFDQNPELSLWPMVVSNVPFNTIEKLVWVFLPLKSDLSNIYKESSEYVMTIQSIRRPRVVFLNTNICMSLFCLKNKNSFQPEKHFLHQAGVTQSSESSVDSDVFYSNKNALDQTRSNIYSSNNKNFMGVLILIMCT